MLISHRILSLSAGQGHVWRTKPLHAPCSTHHAAAAAAAAPLIFLLFLLFLLLVSAFESFLAPSLEYFFFFFFSELAVSHFDRAPSGSSPVSPVLRGGSSWGLTSLLVSGWRDMRPVLCLFCIWLSRFYHPELCVCVLQQRPLPQCDTGDSDTHHKRIHC